VEVPVERYFGPAEKINITVPARVLAHIDEFVRKRGESRSGYLVRAAQEAMRGA
jgi:metal-responsive CopG/Arc/MetJ family transcriptional regulator